VLGGLGGVGLASAGAGLGTSAYLNDTESFEGNTISAGELDLKVDWEEHYSYPQLYGFDDPENGLDYGVHRSEPDEPDNYVGMPDPSNPQVWVHEDDLGTYMMNTSIEAFPDPNHDGVQEVEYEDFTYMPCEQGADLEEDLTPGDMGTATRTDNPSTVGAEDEPKSLISLEDVKPGDFGELTLSFHLCDNPGYVWLQAMGFSEAENGINDPEGEVDDTPETPELAENIQTVWWYDDGDNVLERGDCGDTLYMTDYTNATNDDAVLYEVDISGSGASTTNLGDISNDTYDFDRAHVGASPDGEMLYIIPSDIEDDDPSAGMAVYDVGAGTFSFKDIDLNGEGPLGDVVQVAVDNDGVLYIVNMDNNELFEIADPDAGTPTVTDSMVLDINIAGADCAFTSNSEFYIFTNTDQTLHAVNLLSENTSEIATLETGEYLTGLAVSNSGNGNFVGSSRDNSDLIFFDDDGNQIERRDLTGDLSGHESGDLTTGELCEEKIFSGTLAEAMDEFSADAEGENGSMLNGGDCYQPGFTRYIGFAWWVPTDVGNEIQGDSVEFDLGFYTEQCRNNDEPGTEVPS
jgi:predicted ribosomally synthesized peptide with SipW-like signal peptide